MARKSDVFNVFLKWLALVESKSCRKLKCLRTNSSEEYISNEFQHFSDTCGIKRELTTTRPPAQNGIAERMNFTIQEWMNCMLSHAGLSGGSWVEAIKIAII